jgi:hypothetical protein
MKRKMQKADLKLTVDGNEVVFGPLTAKGMHWIKEERGVDCSDDMEYAAYWKGTDKWSRERAAEFPDTVTEMLGDGLVLDWSEVPAEVQAEAYCSPIFQLHLHLGLIGN